MEEKTVTGYEVNKNFTDDLFRLKSTFSDSAYLVCIFLQLQLEKFPLHQKHEVGKEKTLFLFPFIYLLKGLKHLTNQEKTFITLNKSEPEKRTCSQRKELENARESSHE